MSTSNQIQLSIGDLNFNVTILDNPTVSAFQLLLPLELRMAELNGNEKHADLPSQLPTAAINPDSIRAGDIMLYGSRTLVLWYEDYSSSYTYTRIGSIDDADTFVDIVANQGTIDVRFSTEILSTNENSGSSGINGSSGASGSSGRSSDSRTTSASRATSASGTTSASRTVSSSSTEHSNGVDGCHLKRGSFFMIFLCFQYIFMFA